MRSRTGQAHEIRAIAGSHRGRACGLTLLLLAFAAQAGTARADGPLTESPFSFERYEEIPEKFQYSQSRESKPPSVNFRRNELRAVEAPTRYRTSSILKYTTPLGDTGLELRVKLPLKMKKLVKLELRF